MAHGGRDQVLEDAVGPGRDLHLIVSATGSHFRVLSYG